LGRGLFTGGSLVLAGVIARERGGVTRGETPPLPDRIR